MQQPYKKKSGKCVQVANNITPTIFILNGPNLNRLGSREPEIYGTVTLDDIAGQCTKVGQELGVSIEFRQSNYEGELVSWVQEAADRAQGVIINAGAYTHTSIALLDALKMLHIPIIEVHLSNVFQREEFRAHSYISLVATGVICGLGTEGYTLALQAIEKLINRK
jgi:3-dehydroquinate dehydratase-2